MATLVGIEGSSYRDLGARMLFEASGSFSGNVSGGCLEEDVRLHAEQVRESGIAKRVVYETSGSEDTILGSGSGCGGRIEVLVHKIGREQLEVVTEIAQCLSGDQPFELSIMLDGQLVPGLALDALLVERFEPPPLLLICGGGNDAQPLCRIASDVGFRVEVADHRPTYLTDVRFPEARKLHLMWPDEEIETALTQGSFAVVMSHHLERDSLWVQRLLQSKLDYIGLLGPAARRDRILDGLSDPDRDRLSAPVGLQLGGKGAEVIALSIVAEMTLLHFNAQTEISSELGAHHG